MKSILKKALDQIQADENLKRKTAEYILNADANIISINSAAVRKKPVFAKKFIAVACAALVFCSLPVGAYAYYKTPTSYVSVDINPSVELGINSFGKVVSAKAYNDDGKKVLEGLSLLGMNVESAVRQLVKAASQNGYIKEDGSTFISVTAETDNEATAEKLEEAAAAGAQDAVDDADDRATIETDHIALDRRDEAVALGITPGKLNLIQKLQALDPSIKTEDYKDAAVSVIQKKFTELKKEHKYQAGDADSEASASPSPSTSPSPSPSVSPSDASSAPTEEQSTEDNDSKPNNNSNDHQNDGGNNNKDEHNNGNSGGNGKYNK